MIEVSGLTKSYGQHLAIQNLTFTINKGEVVGFLGPNGAGKSTTMKIITGYMAPTSGEAKVCGFDVFENPIEVKKRIGYLPETPPVYLDMYVKDYLQYVAELKGVEKNKIKANIDRALEKTNLQDVRSRMIGNLSKGFRQRVGIAQALVSDPDVLILDEPTVGLDPKQVAEIRELIKELRGQHTIILSTHILPEVQAVCERIIIINKGHIVAQDSLSNLSRLKTGGRKVNLRLKRSSPDVMGILSHVAGVSKVHTGVSQQDWVLDTTENDEVIEAVAQEVMKKGLGLLEISSAKADLEDVFLKLTYGESESKIEPKVEVTHG
ncbi:MAG: ABC transporter ATP-binding protein [Oligoflexia bacterium]|nr:MAG: ABC transporter ATP-binding protein [Oligoflexia bacterium]